MVEFLLSYVRVYVYWPGWVYVSHLGIIVDFYLCFGWISEWTGSSAYIRFTWWVCWLAVRKLSVDLTCLTRVAWIRYTWVPEIRWYHEVTVFNWIYKWLERKFVKVLITWHCVLGWDGWKKVLTYGWCCNCAWTSVFSIYRGALRLCLASIVAIISFFYSQ